MSWATNSARTCSSWRQWKTSIRSRHTRRTAPTNRSANQFARGDRIGVLMILAPSEEHLVEAGRELGVSVSDEEFGRVNPLGQDEAEIAGRLGDPLPHRVGRDAGDVHPPRVDLHEEGPVEPANNHVDREEVTCQHRRRLSSQEIRPGRTSSPRRGLDAVAAQDRPHPRGRQNHAHRGQLAVDPAVAPSGILFGEAVPA